MSGVLPGRVSPPPAHPVQVALLRVTTICMYVTSSWRRR